MEIEIINSSEESSFLVVSSLIVVDFSVSKKKRKKGEKHARHCVSRNYESDSDSCTSTRCGLDGGFVQGA